MNQLNSLLKKHISLVATQKSLSVFRMVLFGSILLDLCKLSSNLPFSVPADTSRIFILPALWITALTCFLGYKTRISSILFYFLFYKFANYPHDSYEPEPIVTLFALLFVFAPSSTIWSLDSIAKKIRINSRISSCYILAVFAVEYSIYYQAGVAKIIAPTWTDGISFALANYVPYMVSVKLPSFLYNSYLSFIGSWTVIIYECLFFLVLFKPFRKSFAIYGLILHLGIALVTPLKVFGIMMMAPLFMFLKVGDPKEEASETAWLKLLTYTYAIIIACGSSLMIYKKNAEAKFYKIFGMHRNAYYHDGVFRTEGPFFQINLVTEKQKLHLPSFDNNGYPTVQDRDWRIWGFFLRRDRCIDYFKAYLERYRNSCSSNCKIEISAKDMSIKDFKFNSDLIDDLRQRKWTPVGNFKFEADEISWQPYNTDEAKYLNDQFLNQCNKS